MHMKKSVTATCISGGHSISVIILKEILQIIKGRTCCLVQNRRFNADIY